MTEPLIFFANFILRAAAMVFALRFLLQAVQASFYNPVSRGIVRLSDPVLAPLRLVLRPYRNLDFAAFAMTWAAHLGVGVVFVQARELPMIWLFLASDALRLTLSLFIGMFLVAIVVVIVASWLAPSVRSPVVALASEIAEPVLAPARRLLPDLGGIDFSPMVTGAVLLFIQSYVLELLLPFRLWAG